MDDKNEELKERLARLILERPLLLQELARRFESDEIVDEDGKPVVLP